MKKIIYLSTNELKILTPIKVNYPKGMTKMFGAFTTRKQAEKWGGEVVEMEITNRPRKA